MKENEYGFKHLSHNKKWYIYPNCKENLLKAIEDGYQLEYDTNDVIDCHKIWVPYDGEIEIIQHFTCYRMIPKEEN